MPDAPPDADTVETTRVALYASFANRGRAPTVPELSTSIGYSPSAIRQSLCALHTSRAIVLSPAALASFTANEDTHDTDPHAVLMAHPFASIPLGFSVMGTSTLWWGGCAWDSFALAHLLPSQGPMLIATRCPGCDLPLAFDVDANAPPPDEAAINRNGTSVAHFLTPTRRMWDDVVRTCSHQSLFCSEVCLGKWLDRTGREKGYVMGLGQLWHFAKGWYAGRLEYGYQRREPSAAREYFRSVGLRGEFWGL